MSLARADNAGELTVANVPSPLPPTQSALAAFGVARAANAGELTVANVFYSLALLSLPQLYMTSFFVLGVSNVSCCDESPAFGFNAFACSDNLFVPETAAAAAHPSRTQLSPCPLPHPTPYTRWRQIQFMSELRITMRRCATSFLLLLCGSLYVFTVTVCRVLAVCSGGDGARAICGGLETAAVLSW